VSTTVGSTPVPAPTIPLTPEVRAAYQDLFNKIQTAIDSTMDLATIEALNAWQPEIDQVLTQNDEYTLSQDTNILTALQKQIKCVNDGISELRSQISSIASHIAMAGDIIAAIDKVLSLVS
jgi:septal ring factor EnvC (AmiA/AmiB activator)